MLLGLLVEVGDCDTSSQDGIVGVGDCHVRGSLGGLDKERVRTCRLDRIVSGRAHKIVELRSCDTSIDTRYDLLGDCHGVDVVWVEAITESGHTGGDLVELDALLAPICKLLEWITAIVVFRERKHTALLDIHGGGDVGWDQGRRVIL